MTVPIPDYAVLFFLTFARVGTLVMLLPGLGERLIPPRIRLGFALLLTLVFFPAVQGLLPADRGPPALVGILAGELLIGAVLGLATRMVLAALLTAGAIVAQALGLSFAMTVDPTQGGSQEAAISNLLNLLGITLIFALDIHHLAIAAIRDSYVLLPPALLPDPGDAARLAIGAVARGFQLAVRISAPFIAFAFLFNLGLGILSRLMPQMQVFFVGVPLSIALGMAVLLVVLGAMMTLFVQDLGRFLTGLGAA